MIKHKGDINTAIKNLSADKNNAVSHVYKDAKNTSGILSDATFTLKDLFATDNAPTQASSKILEGFEPGYNATVVQKLIEQGAAIVAKTHMDELALGGSGAYSAFGKINNPLDSTRMPGGSSSGAATTFDDSISVAIGSDTGDSVRLPASYTGIVGFKPSYGAVSRYGVFPFASSLDTVAWFAHNVSDVITTSQVLFARDDKDFTSKEVEVPKVELIKPKKVAVLNMHGVLSKSAAADFENLVTKLKADGIEVEEVTIEKSLLEAIGPVYDVVSFSEVSSNDANLTGISFGKRMEGNNWEETMINSRSKGLGPMVQRRFALGALYLLHENQEEVFIKAQKVRRVIVDAFAKIYENFDVLIYPTATIAPKWADGKAKGWYQSMLSHNNFEGTPSISIPFTKEDDMPIGLSIDAKIYEDKKMLSHALYFEKVLGGKDE